MSDTELAQVLSRFPMAMRIGSHDAWLAPPDEMVGALISEGFEEYRCEIVRSRRDQRGLGGIWQGLQRSTARVVSVIWVNRGEARPAVVFVDSDDAPVPEAVTGAGAWWDDVDKGVLECLAGGLSMTPADIGRRLGMSEDGVMSVIAMLAQEGKLRISLVTAAESDLVERSVQCPVHGIDVTIQARETFGARAVRVTWCTAFQPATAVTCNSDCLRAARPGERAEDAPRDASVAAPRKPGSIVTPPGRSAAA
jgi:hypothetical protein